jgi:CheY-like chemotaxis protein
MLSRDPALDDGQRKKVEIIENSGCSLLNLVNDILDIAKIDANAMELSEVDFDVVDLLQSIGLMFDGRCEEKRLAWTFNNLGNKHIPVNGDQGKLRQILINLLSNAVKFTRKGSVTLTLSSQANNHYRFEVRDSGDGIDPEQQKEIFETFGQTTQGAKQGGTGLGLSMADKYIKLMGGKLQLRSEIDKGCRFFFTLPLTPTKAALESHQDSPVRAIKLAEGKTICAMVVDNTKIYRDVLMHMLTEAGVTVTPAQSGQDALDKLQQAETLPDLIFMENRMPMMDGITTLEQIGLNFKARTPRCIVVTSHAMPQDVEHYLNQGFDHCITKPFRIETINDCIHQLLDVEFEVYDEPLEADLPKASAMDLSQLTVPADLLHALKAAASDYEMSKLETCLTTLATINEQGRIFAEHLNQYIQQYDMDTLLIELEKLSEE